MLMSVGGKFNLMPHMEFASSESPGLTPCLLACRLMSSNKTLINPGQPLVSED